MSRRMWLTFIGLSVRQNGPNGSKWEYGDSGLCNRKTLCLLQKRLVQHTEWNFFPFFVNVVCDIL